MSSDRSTKSAPRRLLAATLICQDRCARNFETILCLAFPLISCPDTTGGATNLIKENTKVVLWCLIEISSALIACCLPVLRPLFSEGWIGRVFQKVRSNILPESLTSLNPSPRALEEGMACKSIGGTDFNDLLKKETRSRKDSKLSSSVDARELEREISLEFLTEPEAIMRKSRDFD